MPPSAPAPPRRIGLILLSALLLVAGCTPASQVHLQHQAAFRAEITGVSQERLGLSWRPGCPVGPGDLRLLRVSYWGFDNSPHTGEIILHARIAYAALAAFQRLWNDRYPINRMETAEKFARASDFGPDGSYNPPPPGPDLVNDTYSFFCRKTTGGTSWSAHAYGLAIDINPVHNPYVKSSTIIPTNGFVPRVTYPGVLVPGDAAIRAFTDQGFEWGGNWRSLKDYMHFTANGR